MVGTEPKGHVAGGYLKRIIANAIALYFIANGYSAAKADEATCADVVQSLEVGPFSRVEPVAGEALSVKAFGNSVEHYLDLEVTLNAEWSHGSIADLFSFGDDQRKTELLHLLAGGGRTFRVSEFLPASLRERLGAGANANCFDTAMAFFDPSGIGTRIAPIHLLNRLQNPDHFQEISVGTPLRYGDIVYVQQGWPSIQDFSCFVPGHAMVAVGHGYVFHKMTYQKHTPYAFAKLDSALQFVKRCSDHQGIRVNAYRPK